MSKVIPKNKVNMISPVSFTAIECVLVNLLCKMLRLVSLVCLHKTHSGATVKQIKTLRRRVVSNQFMCKNTLKIFILLGKKSRFPYEFHVFLHLPIFLEIVRHSCKHHSINTHFNQKSCMSRTVSKYIKHPCNMWRFNLEFVCNPLSTCVHIIKEIISRTGLFVRAYSSTVYYFKLTSFDQISYLTLLVCIKLLLIPPFKKVQITNCVCS